MTTHPVRLAAMGALALAVTAGSTACQSDDPAPPPATAATSGAGVASGEPNPGQKMADLHLTHWPEWEGAIEIRRISEPDEAPPGT